MMCMVLNVEWVSVKRSGSGGCCADWGETDNFLGSFEGCCFKIQISQGLQCCYQPVIYHYVILNYSVLMAKFWSSDVGAGGDILLESGAKIETRTLNDVFGEVDFPSTKFVFLF